MKQNDHQNCAPPQGITLREPFGWGTELNLYTIILIQMCNFQPLNAARSCDLEEMIFWFEATPSTKLRGAGLQHRPFRTRYRIPRKADAAASIR